MHAEALEEPRQSRESRDEAPEIFQASRLDIRRAVPARITDLDGRPLQMSFGLIHPAAGTAGILFSLGRSLYGPARSGTNSIIPGTIEYMDSHARRPLWMPVGKVMALSHWLP